MCDHSDDEEEEEEEEEDDDDDEVTPPREKRPSNKRMMGADVVRLPASSSELSKLAMKQNPFDKNISWLFDDLFIELM